MKNLSLIVLCTCLLSVAGCGDDSDGGDSSADTGGSGNSGADSANACDQDACNECNLEAVLQMMEPMCDAECEGCMTSGADGSGDASESDTNDTNDTTAPDLGDFGEPCEDQVATGQSADCEAPTNCWAFGGPDYCTIKCSSNDECPETFECGSVGPESQDYCKPQ